MSEGWTIERVEIQTREQYLAEYPYDPLAIPPGSVRGIAYGKMNDGRPFVWETTYVEAHLHLIGEESLRDVIREDAHPPEEEARESE